MCWALALALLADFSCEVSLASSLLKSNFGCGVWPRASAAPAFSFRASVVPVFRFRLGWLGFFFFLDHDLRLFHRWRLDLGLRPGSGFGCGFLAEAAVAQRPVLPGAAGRPQFDVVKPPACCASTARQKQEGHRTRCTSTVASASAYFLPGGAFEDHRLLAAGFQADLVEMQLLHLVEHFDHILVGCVAIAGHQHRRHLLVAPLSCSSTPRIRAGCRPWFPCRRYRTPTGGHPALTSTFRYLSGLPGAVPDSGRLTELVVIIGVATMKMTSSTSITSM